MVPRMLPLDMEEEILVRVPPLSLLRFRSVCKEWNTLINNNRFVNKNFACGRPELMLNTHSHIYSISFNLNDDPTIKVRDLCFGLSVDRYHHYGICDGYFFFMGNYDDKGYVAWNPMLRHKRIIRKEWRVSGIRVGYDVSKPEKSYKIVKIKGPHFHNKVIKIYSVSEYETNAWKVTGFNPNSMMEGILHHNVRLNGNFYWIAYTYPETGKYYIQILDHSKEIIKTFCILPCKGETSSSHTRVLEIYKGDRFSVLEQCKRTRQIEIWVTKNKIGNGDDGDNVVWIKFMTFSIPDFPMVLIHKSRSYFVDNNIYGKSFVYCCHNKELQQVWVYIVKGDDLCKKIKIDEVVCEFQSSVYVPSLITIS